MKLRSVACSRRMIFTTTGSYRLGPVVDARKTSHPPRAMRGADVAPEGARESARRARRGAGGASGSARSADGVDMPATFEEAGFGPSSAVRVGAAAAPAAAGGSLTRGALRAAPTIGRRALSRAGTSFRPPQLKIRNRVRRVSDRVREAGALGRHAPPRPRHAWPPPGPPIPHASEPRPAGAPVPRGRRRRQWHPAAGRRRPAIGLVAARGHERARARSDVQALMRSAVVRHHGARRSWTVQQPWSGEERVDSALGRRGLSRSRNRP